MENKKFFSHLEGEQIIQYTDRVKSFFEMKEKDEEVLRERIRESGGLVRVFIHPNFIIYAGIAEDNKRTMEEDYPNTFDLQQANAAFERILSTENTPPVFAFLGWNDISEFLEEKREIKNDIYLVPTVNCSSTPLTPEFAPKKKRVGLFGDRMLTKENYEKRKEIGWQELIQKLQRLGVRQILIGGAELYVSKDEKNLHGGCLGSAINRLKKSFDIDVSALTWPEGRKELFSK